MTRPRKTLITLTVTASLLLTACSGTTSASGGGDATEAPASTTEPTEIEAATASAPSPSRAPIEELKGLAAPPDDAVPEPPRPDKEISAIVGEEQFATLEDYLHTIMADLEAVWVPWFLNSGYNEPDLMYFVISAGQVESANCIDPYTGSIPFLVETNYPNVFYCGNQQTLGADGHLYDGGLYLPVGMMAAIYNAQVFPGTIPGDFAAAYVVAHEYGHHIVDEMVKQAGFTRPEKPMSELIADCLAGVWAASVGYRELLAPGDLDEALTAAYAGGELPGQRPDHGLKEERAGAFLVGFSGMPDYGYNAGDPQGCWDYYWAFDENTQDNYWSPYLDTRLPVYP
ncbi:neutral zinc metallopeptidase [Geodermatophilus sp. URMC 64]